MEFELSVHIVSLPLYRLRQKCQCYDIQRYTRKTKSEILEVIKQHFEIILKRFVLRYINKFRIWKSEKFNYTCSTCDICYQSLDVFKHCAVCKFVMCDDCFDQLRDPTICPQCRSYHKVELDSTYNFITNVIDKLIVLNNSTLKRKWKYLKINLLTHKIANKLIRIWLKRKRINNYLSLFNS